MSITLPATAEIALPGNMLQLRIRAGRLPDSPPAPDLQSDWDGMLVLSRQAGDRIQIGDDIVLTVVKVSPHSVRIGVEAPASIAIVRAELIDKITDPPTTDHQPATKPSGKRAG